jgi:hypothetical protein
MSLASSDFEDAGFDNAGFDDGLETSAEVEGVKGQTPVPKAPLYRKQGFSIYTVMLILSFVFLIVAIILLFMEVDRFSQ